jgi:hypothetical protein
MKRTIQLSAVSSALAIAAVLAFSGQAVAEQVRGDQRSIQGLGTIQNNVQNGNAGRFTFDRQPLLSGQGPEFQGILNSNGGPTNLGLSDDVFYAFCLEPNEFLLDPETYNVVDLANAPVSGVSGAMGSRADDMRLLLGNVYPDFSVAISNQKATALQIAIWEIANETNTVYDVEATSNDRGVFYVNNYDLTARKDAQKWLDAINDGTFTGAALTNLVGLVAINSDGTNRQDFVAQVVPIPAAAWLFGSALIGAVGLGRRKQKKELAAA